MREDVLWSGERQWPIPSPPSTGTTLPVT
jgi:hypothetical protein